MYLAFDTGKRNGVAHFNIYGRLIYSDILEVEELIEYLEEINWPNVQGVIYEEYIVDPRIPQGGSKNEASQVIGMIRAKCKIHKVGFFPVQRKNREEGRGWAGIDPIKGHMPDDIAAISIGTYWLVKNNIIKQGTLPTNAY